MKQVALWVFRAIVGAILCALPQAVLAGEPAAHKTHKGVLLEKLTWVEAEEVLTPHTVVVIPLGAAMKEHGPHLPLNTDFLQAEYYKEFVLQETNVVVLPTVPYHFYPAFLEYPGSVSIQWRPAKYHIIDICRSLAGYGPRRFYVINIGISTTAVLSEAAEDLKDEGILLHYTDRMRATQAYRNLFSNTEGTHANEVETSVMLVVAPQAVNMAKSVRDFNIEGSAGGLTRKPGTQETYSPTGVWGDATKATVEKGAVAVEVYRRTILGDIEELRQAPILPSSKLAVVP